MWLSATLSVLLIAVVGWLADPKAEARLRRWVRARSDR